MRQLQRLDGGPRVVWHRCIPEIWEILTNGNSRGPDFGSATALSAWSSSSSFVQVLACWWDRTCHRAYAPVQVASSSSGAISLLLIISPSSTQRPAILPSTHPCPFSKHRHVLQLARPPSAVIVDHPTTLAATHTLHHTRASSWMRGIHHLRHMHQLDAGEQHDSGQAIAATKRGGPLGPVAAQLDAEFRSLLGIPLRGPPSRLARLEGPSYQTLSANLHALCKEFGTEATAAMLRRDAGAILIPLHSIVERMGFLQQRLVADESEVHRMVALCPHILGLTTGNLGDKIQVMEALLCPDDCGSALKQRPDQSASATATKHSMQLRSVLLIAPTLLTHSSAGMSEKVEQLVLLMGRSRAACLAVIRKWPMLLHIPPATMQANVGTLWQQFDDEVASRILARAPYLLACDAAGVVRHWEALWGLFGAARARAVVLSSPSVLGNKPQTIDAKWRQLEALAARSERWQAELQRMRGGNLGRMLTASAKLVKRRLEHVLSVGKAGLDGFALSRVVAWTEDDFRAHFSDAAAVDVPPRNY